MKLFDQDLMSNEKIGESWNIVDRDEEQSRCEISKGKFISIRKIPLVILDLEW